MVFGKVLTARIKGIELVEEGAKIVISLADVNSEVATVFSVGRVGEDSTGAGTSQALSRKLITRHKNISFFKKAFPLHLLIISR